VINNITPFAIDSLGFMALATGSVLVAWSPWQDKFITWLVFASIAFLATWLDFESAVFFVAFLIPPYFAVWWSRSNKGLSSHWALTGIIVWQVAVFVTVKGYAGLESLRFGDQPIVTIGLSYILFRQLHLVIEAASHEALPLTLPRYIVYTLSFWTILAGPIQRYPDFCKGMETIGRPKVDVVLAALHRGINGAFKAFLIAPIFFQPENIILLLEPGITGTDWAVVLYTFPIYLYLNFSGYTDLVISVAELCGMRTMPENFNHPYLARNVQDFWGRWHLSFSHWMRDYVFMPLNVAVHRNLPVRIQGLGLGLTVLVTFILVGVWHGTTVEFLVFGILHGAGVIVVSILGTVLKQMFGRKVKKRIVSHPIWIVAAWFITFHFTCLTFLLINNELEATWQVIVALVK
jgi:D-alanyl-lipoteichoic acid acyltransferase DltB (MBOAT superfamily)